MALKEFPITICRNLLIFKNKKNNSVYGLSIFVSTWHGLTESNSCLVNRICLHCDTNHVGGRGKMPLVSTHFWTLKNPLKKSKHPQLPDRVLQVHLSEVQRPVLQRGMLQVEGASEVLWRVLQILHTGWVGGSCNYSGKSGGYAKDLWHT